MSTVNVNLRVTLRKPPAGVQYCLQKGKAELIDPQVSTGANLTFEWSMPAQPSGEGVRFTGPFAQGPPAARFVYICVGTLAGQLGSPWTRRVKVPLSGVVWTMLAAANGQSLQAAFEGVARDGTPSCASVKLIEGWQIGSTKGKKR